MKKKVLFSMVFFAFQLFQSCFVNRTARPMLTGYIYDAYSNQPIDSCLVGESFTNSKGYYQLDEIRYRQFEIPLPGGEAPPVMVNEVVEKKGYENSFIEGFSTYGGGSKKGAHWKMDTIFLKRKK